MDTQPTELHPPMPKSALIQAIDAQDVGQIREILTNHPEMDCNHLTANGLSALWLALCPPTGKRISREVVQCLLNAKRTNHYALINPIQTFNGLRPSSFIRNLIPLARIQNSSLSTENAALFQTLLSDLDAAELNYLLLPPVEPQGLRAIAADEQNAHDSTVAKVARFNLAALYEHYILDEAHKLDQNAIAWIQMILQARIAELKNDFSTRQSAKQMEMGLAFCLQSKTGFALSTDSGVQFSLTLAETLALLGHALQDMHPHYLPVERVLTEQVLMDVRADRVQAVLNQLYDIATAYGPNHPSCEGGALHRLAFALTACHQLVQNDTNERLSGTMAAMVMGQYFRDELDALVQNNQPQFWLVLRSQMLANPYSDADDKAYQAYVKASRTAWEKSLLERKIEEETVKKLLASIEATYPCVFHDLSRQLLLLLNANPERKALLACFKDHYSPAEGLIQARQAAIINLQQQPSWQSLLASLGLQVEESLTSRFISKYLDYLRHEGDQQGCFYALFKPGMLLNSAQAMAIRILALTLFEQAQEDLASQFPNQAEWLRRLTQAEQMEIFDDLFDRYPGTQLHDWQSLMPNLIEIALQKGFLRHIRLKGMIFRDLDWRGYCLDQVDMSGSTWINCNLSLVSSRGANLEGVVFENCQFFPMVEFLYPQKDYDLRLMMLHRAVELGSSLALQAFFAYYKNQVNADMLASQEGLHTALSLALYENNIDIFRIILNHPACTTRVLKKVAYLKLNCFQQAVINSQLDALRLILEHPSFSPGLFQSVMFTNETALLWVVSHLKNEQVDAYDDRLEILRLLLNHPACSEEYLAGEVFDTDETLLMRAARFTNITPLRLILASPAFTQAVFKEQSLALDVADTALTIAAETKNTQALALLLSHPYCSMQDILYTIRHFPTEIESLHPKPPILSLTNALLAYRDSYRSRLSSFFGTRHHRAFVIRLLKDQAALADRAVMKQRIADYAATQSINPQGHFQQIIRLSEELEMPPMTVGAAPRVLIPT